ncbi:MAG: DUF2087 domain-containing protein [Neomegalonema sp.]|nr:DUF2087 domain-containing protein [Neomegalonema sp.]
MPRQPISVAITDVSQFSKALRRSLDVDVGHQTMMNVVARAAGFQNFQHLKAGQAEDEEPLEARALERALVLFDAQGRLVKWPGRRKIQLLCLWAVWAQLPDRKVLSERQISDRIDALCTFRDAAQIRRGMIEMGLFQRRIDGSEYRRVERRPGATERALIASVVARVRARKGPDD